MIPILLFVETISSIPTISHAFPFCLICKSSWICISSISMPPLRPNGARLGGSGEILFVNQSNFFLNNNADRHPSSRNTQQEYSFHLYCGGASPTKHPISTILCNYAPASGKSRPDSPNASQSWFKHLDPLHIYSIGAAIRKNDEWNSLDGPKWRHTLTSVQIQCTDRWNYARWGQIWTYKKKKTKKKRL